MTVAWSRTRRKEARRESSLPRSRRRADTLKLSGDSWARIHSVYPDIPKNSDFPRGHCIANMGVDKLLRTGISGSHFGRTIEVTANDSAMFQKKIGRFVDSAEKDLGKKKRSKDGAEKTTKEDRPQEYWPIIKVVRIYVKAGECHFLPCDPGAS